MKTEAPPRLLTVGQVADRLQVSRWSVYRRVQAGELPAVKLGSSRHSPIRVDAEELEQWLRSGPEPEENR